MLQRVGLCLQKHNIGAYLEPAFTGRVRFLLLSWQHQRGEWNSMHWCWLWKMSFWASPFRNPPADSKGCRPSDAGKVKVKASHTRYRALGPELILVYRQSACRWPLSHPPGGRLPLLSARPAVTSPAAEHQRPLASTKLYCLVTEAHRCKQLA